MIERSLSGVNSHLHQQRSSLLVRILGVLILAHKLKTYSRDRFRPKFQSHVEVKLDFEAQITAPPLELI